MRTKQKGCLMTMIRRASEMVELRVRSGKTGKPAWLNLSARRLLPQSHPDLRGPGIYGLFLDGALFYVGVFAGSAHNPFGGSVLHKRWFMHLTYQTLRSQAVVFAPEQMQRILRELDGPVSQGFADLLGGRNVDCHALDPIIFPLIARPNKNGFQNGNCTINKVQFAERHWLILGPDRITPEALADRITIAYKTVPESWRRAVPTDLGDRAGLWAKKNWLFDAETDLIARLRPACNSETPLHDVRDDVTIAMFTGELSRLFIGAAPAAPTDVAVHPAENLSPVADITDDPLTGPTTVDAGEDDQGSIVVEYEDELVLPGADEDSSEQAMIARLVDLCPAAFEVYATRNDVRIALRGPRRKPLLTLALSRGAFRCNARAPVNVCAALGFDAAPAAVGTQMDSSFTFEPRRHEAVDLIAVAGAALRGS